MLLNAEQENRRIDGSINILMGYIANKMSDDYAVELSEAFVLLYSSNLYERLCDHSTYLYLMDPLELYSMFVAELLFPTI
jgi:hypothetical protein